MNMPLQLGVVGLGGIGRVHAESISNSGFGRLAAVADPSSAAREYCAKHGIPWFASHHDMLAQSRLDGGIIASPNNTHFPIGLDFIAAGIPILLENPLASTVEEAVELAVASAKQGVAILVGCQRRHNPVVRYVRALIGEGMLGRLTNISVLAAMYKPGDYFAQAWRKEAGGGPILIDLIHEIDLIRYICGEIEEVQALTSSAVREFAVEDSAAVVARIAGGALVSISLSDSAQTPWSWDLASGENASYPPQVQENPTHFFCGTGGALSMPNLECWGYRQVPSWSSEINRGRLRVQAANPYLEQLQHFCQVVYGKEEPLISAADATKTLRAALAVAQAANEGRRVPLI